MKHNVKFKQWNCEVELGEYPNGRKAIQLFDKKTGDYVLVASINIPDEELSVEEIIIKDYSENSGIMAVLINAKIISYPERFTLNALSAPICKLLIQ
ncbi:MAG: hypothetical protein ACJ77K_19195 [Bacteroidia bacterium]